MNAVHFFNIRHVFFCFFFQCGSGGNSGSNQSKKAVVMLRVTVEPITPSHVYLRSADLRARLVPAKNGDISHGARCLWMCKQKGDIGYIYVHEGDIWLQQPTQHPPKTHSDISGERISRGGGRKSSHFCIMECAVIFLKCWLVQFQCLINLSSSCWLSVHWL